MANYLEEGARDSAKSMMNSALTYHFGLQRGDNLGRNMRSPYLLTMGNSMANFMTYTYYLEQGNYWGKSDQDIPEEVEDQLYDKEDQIKESSDLNYLLETKSPEEMLQMVAKYEPEPGRPEVDCWTPLKPDEIMANMNRELVKEKPNRDREKSIAAELKQTTSKSFSGKLKSFFVGNSKEYDKALKAMEDVSEGKVSKENAKKSIMDYLDIRKNKVRDHQYGRERFDGFMKGLQTLMEPQEFADYCKGVDDARRARDPSYKGVTNPEDYMSPEAKQKLAQEREQEAARREAEARLEQDIERIRDDGVEPGRAERNQGFLDRLRSVKDPGTADIERFRDYTERHPAVREEARKIAEQKGLDIDIPTTAVDKMEKADQENLREQEKNVQDLDRQKHAPAKEQPKGPEAGG